MCAFLFFRRPEFSRWRLLYTSRLAGPDVERTRTTSLKEKRIKKITFIRTLLYVACHYSTTKVYNMHNDENHYVIISRTHTADGACARPFPALRSPAAAVAPGVRRKLCSCSPNAKHPVFYFTRNEYTELIMRVHNNVVYTLLLLSADITMCFFFIAGLRDTTYLYVHSTYITCSRRHFLSASNNKSI